jgi:GTPase SAR1 family protein
MRSYHTPPLKSLRVIMVGPTGVGKSASTIRFTENQYRDYYCKGELDVVIMTHSRLLLSSSLCLSRLLFLLVVSISVSVCLSVSLPSVLLLPSLYVSPFCFPVPFAFSFAHVPFFPAPTIEDNYRKIGTMNDHQFIFDIFDFPGERLSERPRGERETGKQR